MVYTCGVVSGNRSETNEMHVNLTCSVKDTVARRQTKRIKSQWNCMFLVSCHFCQLFHMSNVFVVHALFFVRCTLSLATDFRLSFVISSLVFQR